MSVVVIRSQTWDKFNILKATIPSTTWDTDSETDAQCTVAVSSLLVLQRSWTNWNSMTAFYHHMQQFC